MSNKKRRKTNRATQAVKSFPAESRAAEALTVAWSVTLTTLFFFDAALLLLAFFIQGSDASSRLALLNALLLFASCVTSLLWLVLLPVVSRVRNEPLPRTLILLGAGLAMAPILMLFFQNL